MITTLPTREVRAQDCTAVICVWWGQNTVRQLLPEFWRAPHHGNLVERRLRLLQQAGQRRLQRLLLDERVAGYALACG